ncbi:MAG: glycoside hydrolase family 3 C-terminal domain-containing protein, partial [Opitutales bacterium]
DWAATHSTLAAALYGLDVEMGTGTPWKENFFADPLIEAVESGALPEAVVDEMATRVLRVMAAIGINAPDRATGALNTPEHQALVREVAEAAIVLLKNEDALLPLERQGLRRVAVIGDNATRRQSMGGFGAGVKALYEVTPLEGIAHLLGEEVEVVHAPGYRAAWLGDPSVDEWRRAIDYAPDPALVEEAVAAARAADVVIFVGGTNRSVESEAADRTTLRLPFAQEHLLDALLAANPRTVAVIVAGAAVDLRRTAEVAPALVWSWFNGSESGTALARVLFGEVNPSGRLPFTVPQTLDQIGAHALGAFPGQDGHVVYAEDLLVGYRWLDAHGLEPTFPFGFGLSYSTFEYGSPRLAATPLDRGNTIELTVEVTNRSPRAGKETVQLYVEPPARSPGEPVRTLKAFTKVAIPAGGTQAVALSLPVEDLAVYDPAAGAWVVDTGTYALRVGSSSRHLGAPVTLEITP